MDVINRLAAAIEARSDPHLTLELDSLPKVGTGKSLYELAASQSLDTRLFAIGMLAEQLAFEGHFADAGRIAEAALKVAVAHLDQDGSSRMLVAGAAGQLATTLAKALRQAGRHEDIVALLHEIEPRLLDCTDGVRAASLRLEAVEALLCLGRFDEADRALDELERRGSDDPSVPLVRERVDSFRRSATELADSRSRDAKAVDEYKEGAMAAAEAVRRFASAHPQLAGLTAMLVEKAGEAAPKDAWEVFDRSTGWMDRLGGLIGIAGTEHQQWRNRVHAASSLFRESACEPSRLQDSLETFRAAAAWYDERGERSDGHHARWCAYMAERRLGHPAAALDLLEDLAERLEEDRRGISDPLRRADDSFPLLAAARVECADMLGDPRRMLAAIEAAKGRVLADLRTIVEERAVDEATLHATPEEVEALVAQLGVGYASFLVIDVAIFAVAVWPDGSWHRTRIALDEAARRALSRRLDPDRAGTPLRPAAFEPGSALAPVVAWLEPLLPALPKNGHLVYSPHGEIHLWPLHMADTAAGPLGTRVGVSRVHGIDALRRIARSAPKRPALSLVVHVLSRDEGEREAKAAAVDRIAALLPEPTAIAGEDAEPECLAGLKAEGTLLYLNAHGVFPGEHAMHAMDSNPYREAGLMLARDGMLPLRSASWPHRLTPALVLESPGLDVRGAVLLLQGCVSGLAREGRGGDALGLEWAFLARGADTVLASHWNVDYRSAGAFCRRFCKSWLIDGKRRVDAWRDAVAGTRQDPEGGPAHDWGAFSLTGDWR